MDDVMMYIIKKKLIQKNIQDIYQYMNKGFNNCFINDAY